MTLIRPNVRGSDCPSESPCPTTSPSPSPYSPTDFGHLHHLSHQREGRAGSEIGQPRAGHPRDVVVSATRLDARPDLTSITHLDFAPAIPCECGPVEDPCVESADLVLEDTRCTTCGDDDGRWLCAVSCWDEMGEPGGVACRACGANFDRDDVLRIIGRLS